MQLIQGSFCSVLDNLNQIEFCYVISLNAVWLRSESKTGFTFYRVITSKIKISLIENQKITYQMVHTVAKTLFNQLIAQIGESFCWPNPHEMFAYPLGHFPVEFIHPISYCYWEAFNDTRNASGTRLHEKESFKTRFSFILS